MIQPIFPVSEYHRRWHQVHELMKVRDIGAAVVWGCSNQTYDRCGDVLYLANYYCSEAPANSQDKHAWGFYAVVMQLGKSPELIADKGDDRTGHLGVSRVSRVANIIEGVVSCLAERNVTGRVAVVGTDVLPWKYADELRSATPQIEWHPMDDLVRTVRRVKSLAELEVLREGGALAGAALDILMKELVAGKREQDAVAEAIRVLYRGGGQGSYISTNHGDTISYWNREPLVGRSESAPKSGDFVRGWMDCAFKGYWFDPGRTAVAGRAATREQRKLIEDCAYIVEGVAAALRPGVTVKEVVAIGDELVRSVGGNGASGEIPRSTYAHGIGLHWETPSVSRASYDLDFVVEANMALGVEYFLNRDGVGTVGIEENILVLDDRNESLLGLPTHGW